MEAVLVLILTEFKRQGHGQGWGVLGWFARGLMGKHMFAIEGAGVTPQTAGK